MEQHFFGEAERETWNQFVSESPESPVLQSFEWGELKRSTGWTPTRLGLLQKGQLVAGISLLKRSLPFGRSLFYAPRGPVFLEGVDSSSLFRELVDAVVSVARAQGGYVLKWDPEISEEERDFVEWMKEARFRRGRGEIQPRATFLLDLNLPLDELFNQFESKTRYNIRLAERKGVRVQEETTPEGVSCFYKIHQETSSRDGFLIHPERYYQNVLSCLGNRGMAKIFLAYLGDHPQPIAGVFIFLFGKRVWYMYGASSNQFRNVMPNHALHGSVIQWAHAQGYRTYDLWGIPVDPQGDHPLWGVYRFKKGFHGVLKKWIGMYDLPLDPFWYNLFDRGIHGFQRVRNFVKKGKWEGALSE